MQSPARAAARVGALVGSVLVVVGMMAGCTTPLVPAADSATAAALTVSSPSLVFIQGTTSIALGSDQSSATWSVADVAGKQVRSGTATVSAGTATIGLTSLGPGYYTLAVSAGAGAAATSRSTSFAVLAPLPSGVRDQRFGVGMHLANGMDSHWIDDAGKVGFGSARTDANWETIEQTPGVYTYSAAGDAAVAELHGLGITPLLIAYGSNAHYDSDTTPSSGAAQAAFAAFASDVAGHYAADTNQLEVFNEFNGSWFNTGACGTTADCYLPLLRATYARVKADHPGTVVVGPAISTVDTAWLNRLFQLGGLSSLNAVSVHQYTSGNPPEPTIRSAVAAARASVDNAGGASLPLALDENGWSTYQGATTEANQADYVIRAEAMALSNGASRYYYDWINDSTNTATSEDNYGLMRRPAIGVTAPSPKPALVTQAVLIRQLAGLAFTGVSDIGYTAYCLHFGSGSTLKGMLWTNNGTTEAVRLTASGPVTVTDEYGRSSVHQPSAGYVPLTLTQHPVFVSGPLTGVTT